MRLSRCLLTLVAAVSLGTGCSRDQLKIAQQYELQGKNAEALAIYEKKLASSSISNAERSEVLSRRGECLFRMDRVTEAFSSFRKAVDINLQNNAARLRLGELYLAAGSPELAREEATHVLDRIATNEDALALLGAAWAAADNATEAKRAYGRVLELNPKLVTVAVALADLYNREDNGREAREILQKAIQDQPASSIPILALARLEEQQGNGDAAEEAYRRAVDAEDTPDTNLRLSQYLQRAGRIAEAEQVLRRVDAQQREYPVALGDFQLTAGHVANALESYRSALDVSAPLGASQFWHRQSEPTAVVFAQEHMQIAARLLETEIIAAAELRAEQKNQALRSITERLKQLRGQIDPGTEAVLETELALASNDLVQARIFAETATKVATDSAAAHYVAGLADWNVGDKDQATTEWKSALDLDSHYVPARLALAEEAIERRDGAAADEFARSVVRDEPGNFKALVLFSRSLLLQNKPTAAAIMAQRASLLDPSASEPALLLGEASLQLERVPEALLSYERAVIAHPESDEAIEGLMKIYRRGSVSYAALQQMERVAKEPPVSAPLFEIAGRLYADRGWYKEAIRSFTEALEADPKRETAARQLARLRFSTGDIPKASAAVAKGGGTSATLLKAFKSQINGDWNHAAANYERVVREGDQSGVAANNLAWLYAEQGLQLDRAQQLAEDAARLSPNNPAVLDTLGFVQWKRREYSAAVKTLETAAQLVNMKPELIEPGVAEQIRKHLRDAYFSAGQTEAATQIAQRRGPFAPK